VIYGKNCFVRVRRAMRGASWLESLPFLPDACPTLALFSPRKMNPAGRNYAAPPRSACFYLSVAIFHTRWVQLLASKDLQLFAKERFFVNLLENK
jgi:hypothetical protein